MEKNSARLVFAVDVAHEGGKARQAVRGVRSIFANHRVAATWAFADLSSPLVAELRDDAGHEISLLAQPSWSGSHAPRSAFHQGFSSQMQRAAVAGICLSSIAVEHAAAPEHLDLLGKLGIGAVRTTRPAVRRWPLTMLLSAETAKPVALRYGVWQMPTTVEVARQGSRAARAAMLRATARSESVVLVIDAQHVPLSTVERLVQAAAHLAGKGRLEIHTLTSAADCLARRRRMTPAQSILRAA
jgi:hypothetical protein